MPDRKIMPYIKWLFEQKIRTKEKSLKTRSTDADEKYTIVGKITALRIIQSKRGQRMAFLQLEDAEGYLELVIFPKIWNQTRTILTSYDILGFSGKIDTSRQNPKFLVENVLRMDEIKEFNNSDVHQRLMK